MFVLGGVFAPATCSALISQYAAVAAKLLQHATKVALSISDPIFLDDGTIDEQATVQQYAGEAAALLRVPDSQCEGIFGLLIALIYNSSFSDLERQFSLVSQVITSIESTPSERAYIKIRMLNIVFNALVPESPLRAVALGTMVDLAAAKKEVTMLAGSQLTSSLGAVVEAIGITAQERLDLLGRFAAAYEGAGLMRQGYLVHVTVLESIIRSIPGGANGRGGPLPHADTEHIRRSFANALVCGLAGKTNAELDFSALWAAACNIDTKRIALPGFRVLEAYVAGDIHAFRKVQSSLGQLAAACCTRIGDGGAAHATKSETQLTPQKAAERIRLVHLSLLPVGLAISYDVLARAVDVKIDQIEQIVVNGMHAGLVMGRLNPIARIFTVSGAAKVHFAASQWMQLELALKQWRLGLGNVDAAIGQLGANISSIDRFDDGEEFQGFLPERTLEINHTHAEPSTENKDGDQQQIAAAVVVVE